MRRILHFVALREVNFTRLRRGVVVLLVGRRGVGAGVSPLRRARRLRLGALCLCDLA